MKSSGYGEDMSTYALEDYTVARHVMVKMQGSVVSLILPGDRRSAPGLDRTW
jgi:hypothetical protein